MEMKWCKLVFKQNQPIHIGKTNWGVVNETEIFIPGWTMWGALVNACLNKEKSFDKNFIDQIQQKFEKITNFYPSFDKDGNNILFPEYKEGEFYLGDYSEKDFRVEFTDSIVQTAVEPIMRSAKEESLHEFEYILPKKKNSIQNKNNEEKQLYWVGLIGFESQSPPQSSEQANLCDKFLNGGSKLYIGGDIKYGFGEIELVKSEETNDLIAWEIDENGKAAFGDNCVIPSFLEFEPQLVKEKFLFEGEIVLLPEFVFQKNQPTIQTSGKSMFYLNVGSKILSRNNKEENRKLLNDLYVLCKGKFVISQKDKTYFFYKFFKEFFENF